MEGNPLIMHRRLFVKHSSNLNSSSCSDTIGQDESTGRKIVLSTHKQQGEQGLATIWAKVIQGSQLLTHPAGARMCTHIHACTHTHSHAHAILISKAQPEIPHLENHYSLSVEFILDLIKARIPLENKRPIYHMIHQCHPQKNENLCSHKDLYRNVNSSFTHTCKELWTTQMSSNRWRAEHAVVYVHHRALPSKKEGWPAMQTTWMNLTDMMLTERSPLKGHIL